jgi:hypothetical protein
MQEFKDACGEEQTLVACAALKYGPMSAMTLSLHNGGIATVVLDTLGAHYLLEALKVLFPDIESPPATPVKVVKRTADTLEIQVGHMSGNS